jgi:hypothetical protein
MIEELAATCEGEGCNRRLGEPMIVYRTAAGERRAYECDCGAVTITAARD